MRAGGNPWLLRLVGAGSTCEVVLKTGDAAADLDRGQLITTVAALELAAGHALPAPRLIASDLDGSQAGTGAILMTVLAGSTPREGCAFPVPPRSFADERHFGVTGPVPENAVGRSLPQQLSHLAGEFFDLVAEQVRRGEGHGEVIGQHALGILHAVRDAGGEDHPWRAEPGAGQGVLEAEGLSRRGALARSPGRSEILPHQLPDLIVRNPRRPGARRDARPSA